MSEEPQIVERLEQPYVAIEATVSMSSLSEAMPPLFPEVFAWLGEHQLAPAGAPFCKYDVIEADDGEHWGSRVEFSLSNPVEEPDMNTWRTELAFRLKD